MDWNQILNNDLLINFLVNIVTGTAPIVGTAWFFYNRLDKKIEKLDEKLSGDIQKLDKKLSGDIEKMDKKLSTDIEKLDNKLSMEIDKLENKVEGEFKKLENKVDCMAKDINLIKERLARIEGKLEHQEFLEWKEVREKSKATG